MSESAQDTAPQRATPIASEPEQLAVLSEVEVSGDDVNCASCCDSNGESSSDDKKPKPKEKGGKSKVKSKSDAQSKERIQRLDQT
jgi:hypothetical protein